MPSPSIISDSFKGTGMVLGKGAGAVGRGAGFLFFTRNGIFGLLGLITLVLIIFTVIDGVQEAIEKKDSLIVIKKVGALFFNQDYNLQSAVDRFGETKERGFWSSLIFLSSIWIYIVWLGVWLLLWGTLFNKFLGENVSPFQKTVLSLFVVILLQFMFNLIVVITEIASTGKSFEEVFVYPFQGVWALVVSYDQWLLPVVDKVLDSTFIKKLTGEI